MASMHVRGIMIDDTATHCITLMMTSQVYVCPLLRMTTVTYDHCYV